MRASVSSALSPVDHLTQPLEVHTPQFGSHSPKPCHALSPLSHPPCKTNPELICQMWTHLASSVLFSVWGLHDAGRPPESHVTFLNFPFLLWAMSLRASRGKVKKFFPIFVIPAPSTVSGTCWRCTRICCVERRAHVHHSGCVAGRAAEEAQQVRS